MKSNILKNPKKYPAWRVSNDKLFKHVSPQYPELANADDYWREVIPRMPVVLHNLSNYDSHLLISDIAQTSPNHQNPGKITSLTKINEKYISSTRHMSESSVKFRFIDSFRFLAPSLDQLAAILTRDDLKILKSEFSDLKQDSLGLLTRKGVYPYDYVSSLDVLKKASVPELSKVYNKLNDALSEADYTHAKNVWRAYNIENPSQYT
ncbi:hypothetical protein NQ315_014807 [Exocentrus adspersus]|uniref:DNA-directed DNA polymerase n=1 Tax=Exocentrus adspersus TaxID=1586481 RepID=A0AAV8VMP2_9CUCU|nr:hypothetical protein NQ315_014807 [Exocentrus adspersus]